METVNIPDKIQLKQLIKVFAQYNVELYKTKYTLKTLEKSLDQTIHKSCTLTRDSFGNLFKQYERLTSKNLEDYKDTKEFRAFIKLLIPGMRLSGVFSYITKPFGNQPVFITDDLLDFLEDGNNYLNMAFDLEEMHKSAKIKTRSYILREHYDLCNLQTEIFHLHTSNKKTGLSRFFQIRINNDYVDIEFKNGKPNIEKSEIFKLAGDMLNDEMWDYYFPPENLSFKGFSRYTWEDVTELESMNRLSLFSNAARLENNQEKFLGELNELIRDYFQNNHIDLGFVNLHKDNLLNNPHESQSLTKIPNGYFFENYEKESFSKIFKKLDDGSDIVLVGDLSEDLSLEYESTLHEKDYKCAAFAPIRFDDKLEILIEFGCKKKMFFDHQMIEKIKRVQNELKLGYQKFLDTYKNRLAAIIQEEYTAIHPSVQWKFEQVVSEQLLNNENEDFKKFQPIVFKDLIPLYGQADIIASSSQRNEAIQEDLIANLTAVRKLMKNWQKKLQLFILDEYIDKVTLALASLETSISSSDENQLIHLLTDQIHPYLNQLAIRYPELNNKRYTDYLKMLDPDLNVVYNKRKQFEKSVTALNSAISDFVEQEDQRMQTVLPHYFEKYKTDGVEYNLYIGDSILKDGGFAEFDIKEFKVWQLINMCEIVNLVDDVSKELPVHLTTAQLIFVYNSALSIRFRMDEKQFDVDGTYNVRYEILKKRIDKAIIKGTRDRLTVAGKIAIVYLSESDKVEYLNYLDYLKQKQLIEDNIEDLELEKMQGVEGLKALRITVKKK